MRIYLFIIIYMNSYKFSDWKEHVDNIIDTQKRIIYCNDDDYSICWQNNMTPEKAVDVLSVNFTDWKKVIDREVYIQTGYHCNEIPDYDYWNAWNNKMVSQEKVITDVINKFRNSYSYDILMGYT